LFEPLTIPSKNLSVSAEFVFKPFKNDFSSVSVLDLDLGLLQVL
tara:strand:- start:153 stop:284 length:132 start_codon:yes stop_codon:yes gene_type:complete